MVFTTVYQITPSLSDGFSKPSLQPFPALGFNFWEFITNVGDVEEIKK